MSSFATILACAVTCATLAVPASSAPSAELTPKQIDEARELLFHDSKVRQYEPSLHAVPADREGVKVLLRSVPLGHRVVSGDSVFGGDADEFLHQTYCSANSIVLAIAGQSSSFITEDKKAILTATHFSVSEVIKPGSRLIVGSGLEVVRPGGDVIDQGERLRVRVSDAQDYVDGQTYLLILWGRLEGEPEIYIQWATQAVRVGRLTSRWEKFAPGTAWADVYAEINRVQSLAPCPRLP